MFFLASENSMIMDNGYLPGIRGEKIKKMVKVERVNFLGSEVQGLADVRGELGGWGDARVEAGRGKGHEEVG